MSLPWPEQYFDIKDEIYSAWGIQDEIEILREFSDGKSAARVFLVDLQSKKHNGQAILKLDKFVRWSDNDLLEGERHERAVQQAENYAKEHFPQLIAADTFKDKTALLCTVAVKGDGSATTDTVVDTATGAESQSGSEQQHSEKEAGNGSVDH
ncbi:MAG: hypothetical protein D3907_14845, partial [Candidatus Electrothrix sp. AUS3]|nr:hypothetical protein [Candidatus Electrothrix gigas]